MALHLKAGDRDLLLITEPALLTRYAWQSHAINCTALLLTSLILFVVYKSVYAWIFHSHTCAGLKRPLHLIGQRAHLLYYINSYAVSEGCLLLSYVRTLIMILMMLFLFARLNGIIGWYTDLIYNTLMFIYKSWCIYVKMLYALKVLLSAMSAISLNNVKQLKHIIKNHKCIIVMQKNSNYIDCQVLW